MKQHLTRIPCPDPGSYPCHEQGMRVNSVFCRFPATCRSTRWDVDPQRPCPCREPYCGRRKATGPWQRSIRNEEGRPTGVLHPRRNVVSELDGFRCPRRRRQRDPSQEGRGPNLRPGHPLHEEVERIGNPGPTLSVPVPLLHALPRQEGFGHLGQVGVFGGRNLRFHHQAVGQPPQRHAGRPLRLLRHRPFGFLRRNPQSVHLTIPARETSWWIVTFPHLGQSSAERSNTVILPISSDITAPPTIDTHKLSPG